jgi:hypothetical protein
VRNRINSVHGYDTSVMKTTLILNGNNEPLAEASSIRPVSGASAGAVLRTTGRDRLLPYYFGDHGRRIVLRAADGSSMAARITGTRWEAGARVWFVRTLADSPPTAERIDARGPDAVRASSLILSGAQSKPAAGSHAGMNFRHSSRPSR